MKRAFITEQFYKKSFTSVFTIIIALYLEKKEKNAKLVDSRNAWKPE